MSASANMSVRKIDWLLSKPHCITLVGCQDLLFDNAKCIMIERDDFGEGKHHWNSHLLQMARDYGFKLRAFGLIAPRPKVRLSDLTAI